MGVTTIGTCAVCNRTRTGRIDGVCDDCRRKGKTKPRRFRLWAIIHRIKDREAGDARNG